MRLAVLLLLSIGLASITASTAAASSSTTTSLPAPTPDPRSISQRRTQLIPIPVYSTRPSEGSTWGFMPVFMIVRGTGDVASIYAPSVSYNDSIRFTGTFRWYHYPTPVRDLTVTASASTRVNWNAQFILRDMPTQPGKFTDELTLRVERNLFYRFFGIGQNTLPEAESSYTRLRGIASYRRGRNITRYFNIGVRLEANYDEVQAIGVRNLPLSPVVFPNAPGMDGSSVTSQFLDLRYDTREHREYSESGIYASWQVGASQGIWNSPAFFQTQFDSRVLFQETSWIQGSARLYWSYIDDARAPFYQQSSLGGSALMRGFIVDRFIDKGAWTAEVEQRLRLRRVRILDVATNWRTDPFLAVGQVYSNIDNIFDHVRVVGGLGLRVWVEPNILGRVDLGYGGEGLKIYVELGYPF